MRIIAEFPAEDIFPRIVRGCGKGHFEGVAYRLGTDRLYVLKSNPVCVCCGIRGTVFRLEYRPKEKPHLNLYAIVNGEAVLMTKDHIIPKVLGGKNDLNNYQTLCKPCNGRKGASLGDEWRVTKH